MASSPAPDSSSDMSMSSMLSKMSSTVLLNLVKVFDSAMSSSIGIIAIMGISFRSILRVAFFGTKGSGESGLDFS